jgi:phage FluMu protein Com
MPQRIRCANCGKVILQTGGDGWIESGWFPCECGYETRVSKANGTNEHRPVGGCQPSPPTCTPCTLGARLQSTRTLADRGK